METHAAVRRRRDAMMIFLGAIAGASIVVTWHYMALARQDLHYNNVTATQLGGKEFHVVELEYAGQGKHVLGVSRDGLNIQLSMQEAIGAAPATFGFWAVKGTSSELSVTTQLSASGELQGTQSITSGSASQDHFVKSWDFDGDGYFDLRYDVKRDQRFVLNGESQFPAQISAKPGLTGPYMISTAEGKKQATFERDHWRFDAEKKR